MKLFSLGPVAMYQHTLEIAGKPIPYFRTPEFSELMLDSEQLLREAVYAERNCKTVFLTASGTAAMEATVMNCFTSDDKLLVVNGGIFGDRFVKICRLHSVPCDEVVLSFGETLTAEHLAPFEKKGYTALLVNIHETSTGQLYDVHMLSDFCKRNRMYLIVDAISSFLADPYRMSEWGIDCTILSSQKGLAIAPGMSIVVLSERLFLEKVSRISCPCMYFDFKEHIQNMTRGQTPFTPAVNIAFQLNDMLHHLQKEGVENRLNHIDMIAKDFRTRLEMIDDIYLPPHPLSNAATPMLFRRENAWGIYETLKREHEIVLTPCGGDLRNRMARVAHLGNHFLDENIHLVSVLDSVLKKV